ncbi:MAG TPA: DNA translocase FtsK, partial [Geobacterales bacterium]|nr:DNA translocase FtsK [Geobacterales bacterium]
LRELLRERTEQPRETIKSDKPAVTAPVRVTIDPPTPVVKAKKGKPAPAASSGEPAAEELIFRAPTGDFQLPPLTLLDPPPAESGVVDEELLAANARTLEQKLKDFGVSGQVTAIAPGPVITLYEFAPGAGVKVNRVSSLADDLSMALQALSIRIVAPIPGKGVVGIELPNKVREMVSLREILGSDPFRTSTLRLPLALGKDISGVPVVADMARMPHLLVAGATGAGKSVSVNTMILSLLYTATPRDVRLIMVDPKMLELSVYEGIPHLLLPVVTNPKKAALALKWAVREMERRYRLMAAKGVRSIDSYNRKVADEESQHVSSEENAELAEAILVEEEVAPAPGEVLEHGHLPSIVVIVDELADLMMVAGREIEESIARLAQMARAAGIHLILATQRPSVDVITGLIKANFPARISFQVSSKTDSRTILDCNGAEALLGAGDMLFLPPGTGKLRRVHGAFVSDTEVERVVEFLRSQGEPTFDETLLTMKESSEGGGTDEEMDPCYDQALAIVAEVRQASTSMLQRRLRIGYNRAARIIDMMEREGVVGPSDGSGKPREVLVSKL